MLPNRSHLMTPERQLVSESHRPVLRLLFRGGRCPRVNLRYQTLVIVLGWVRRATPASKRAPILTAKPRGWIGSAALATISSAMIRMTRRSGVPDGTRLLPCLPTLS
jgi:hypothetical protein